MPGRGRAAHALDALLRWPRVVLTSGDPDVAAVGRGRAGGGALPFVAKDDLPSVRLERMLGAG